MFKYDGDNKRMGDTMTQKAVPVKVEPGEALLQQLQKPTMEEALKRACKSTFRKVTEIGYDVFNPHLVLNDFLLRIEESRASFTEIKGSAYLTPRQQHQENVMVPPPDLYFSISALKNNQPCKLCGLLRYSGTDDKNASVVQWVMEGTRLERTESMEFQDLPRALQLNEMFNEATKGRQVMLTAELVKWFANHAKEGSADLTAAHLDGHSISVATLIDVTTMTCGNSTRASTAVSA